jgi:predicted ester cyclase
MLGMNSYLDRLFQVWTDPDGLDELEVRLAEFYTDPVRVNGSDLSLSDLAARARALHAAFSDLRSETLQVVAENDNLAVAFVMHGRHTGPYETALGTIPPTGLDVQIRTTDVLTITGGKISAVWVNADDLGTLRQLGWRGV